LLFILKRSYGGHDRPDEDVDEGRFPQYEAHPQIQNATVEDQENPRCGTKENKQEVDNGANDPGYWITGNMNSLDETKIRYDDAREEDEKRNDDVHYEINQIRYVICSVMKTAYCPIRHEDIARHP
jgi:hypothetical protein